MADYSRFEPCGCSYYGPHEIGCSLNPETSKVNKAKELNFTASFYAHTDIMSPRRVEYYLCNRGCGCIVWDMESHVQNVCRENNG